ncbi:MAG: hypothetical protein IBJ18_11615 [Phycisphaerales bacterium]|nr:hypothetical protein [Phycisphaerales bacterium]
MQMFNKLVIVFALACASLMLGACGGKAPKAAAMPIEIVLTQDAVAGGRSVFVDLVGVGAGEQGKYNGKAVRDWFAGKDNDRLEGTKIGFVKSLTFKPGESTTRVIKADDEMWNKILGRQAVSLFVFAFVGGEDTAGKDVSWRKELSLDPERYDGEKIRLEVQRGGVYLVNLKPEKK